MPKTIAVDLDGTLAKTTNDGSIGAPISAMVELVKAWDDAGRTVVVFTARPENNFPSIRSWLEENKLPNFDITNIKSPEFSEIYDNRAIRVEKDTGVLCSKCASSVKKSSNHSALYSRTDC